MKRRVLLRLHGIQKAEHGIVVVRSRICEAVAVTIKQGLDILGVSAPKRM